MHVHTVAVVADQRLRHERHGLAVAVRDVLNRVFEDLYLVRLLGQGIRIHADLGLAAGRDLVMMDFGFQAHFLEREAHGAADVLKRVDRRHGEIAALDAGPVAFVAVFIVFVAIPSALYGIDLVSAAAHLGAPGGAVEDEEFIFRPEQRGIGDTRRF